MTGKEYADLIAAYLDKNFGERGIKVYREVTLGKTIIGKNRRIDVFVVHEPTQCVFRTKSITDSGASRSLIPGQADH